jgi:hypothetical protein
MSPHRGRFVCSPRPSRRGDGRRLPTRARCARPPRRTSRRPRGPAPSRHPGARPGRRSTWTTSALRGQILSKTGLGAHELVDELRKVVARRQAVLRPHPKPVPEVRVQEALVSAVVAALRVQPLQHRRVCLTVRRQHQHPRIEPVGQQEVGRRRDVRPLEQIVDVAHDQRVGVHQHHPLEVREPERVELVEGVPEALEQARTPPVAGEPWHRAHLPALRAEACARPLTHLRRGHHDARPRAPLVDQRVPEGLHAGCVVVAMAEHGDVGSARGIDAGRDVHGVLECNTRARPQTGMGPCCPVARARRRGEVAPPLLCSTAWRAPRARPTPKS